MRINPALGATLLLILTGCGYRGADSLPLPGGVSQDEGYAVRVVLEDATNLVAQETCRANDTVIGSVESVDLDDDLDAVVVCRIRTDVELPANVVATLRETSLLGERFVSLEVPEGQRPEGSLQPGAILPAATTRVDPNTEMVLGALSQVLNGGGLANVQTITRELTVALEGSDLGATVDGLGAVAASLNDNRAPITASLDAIDRLTTSLARQRRVIGSALDSIPAGLAVLDRQRPGLVALLGRLADLSDTVLPLIERSKANLVTDLEHLRPVITELAAAGDKIARTIERISSFPFPSNTLRILRGDYGGLGANMELDIDSLNALLGGTESGTTTDDPAPPDDTAEEPGPTLPLDIPGLDISGLDTSILQGLLGGETP